MNTVPKPLRGQRAWTDAQRAEQAEKLRARKIWLNSTGPRTALGKSISSRNSYKHGRFTFDKQVLRWYVRLAALRLKQTKAAWYNQQQKFQNELINQRDARSANKPNIMAFYPYFKIHPLSDEALYPPKKPRASRKSQKPKKSTISSQGLAGINAENSLHNLSEGSKYQP